jgi:GDPmannose 4,6-dehydratase
MAEPRRYLVTGATGQDGSYLVERAIAEGHEVHGMCHTAASVAQLRAVAPACVPHLADLGDDAGLRDLVEEVRPTHIVNLAGRTSVAWSWDSPTEAAELIGIAPVRLYEAAWRQTQSADSPVRVLQASSAEIFGDAVEVPQNERTPLVPINPYGAAKAYAHQMAAIYRSRGLHVSTAILYNHESPRRPETFVTRKIVKGAVSIADGRQDSLTLGNLDARRDWGWAPDYVEAMLQILEQPQSSDYVVATGVAHSVREFVAAAFAAVGIDDWSSKVVVDPALHRPADPRLLVGNASKLRSIGWAPTVDFAALVEKMVAAERETER